MNTATFPQPGLRCGLYPRQAIRDRKWQKRFKDRFLHCNKPKPQPVRWKRFSEQVKTQENKFSSFSETELLNCVLTIKNLLASDGLTETHLETAFLVCGEVIYRHTGWRLFSSQFFAARVILGNSLAEMQTGEGKTLATSLAALVSALAGTPTHVLTANDYLVQRDAEQLKPIANFLGLTVGYVVGPMSPEERREPYQGDITYCSGSELAFDYLRDTQILNKSASPLHLRLHQIQAEDGDQPLLQGLCFAIVDEADNVLLDEACTPLILALQEDCDNLHEVCTQGFALANRLQTEKHYAIDPQTHSIYLTPDGKQFLYTQASLLAKEWNNKSFREEKIQQALTAIRIFEVDNHYLVVDGKVEIIDATTGRIAEGRKWSHGLHAMLEYKEGCEFSGSQRTLARTSFQRLFPRYLKLGGTSATLGTARAELEQVYQLSVIPVPLNEPGLRKNLGLRLFSTESKKHNYVVERVTALNTAGRPVLVGTDSVADSQRLLVALEKHQLHAVLLNARTFENEAEIVAQAGKSGAITVSTNMAGRGTDIKPDDAALAQGGLHVINCQFNYSARLDLQLQGRSARQGDPGSYETVLCLEDESLIKAVSGKLAGRLANRLARDTAQASGLCRRVLMQVQRKMENKARKQRADLVKNELQMEKMLQGLSG